MTMTLLFICLLSISSVQSFLFGNGGSTGGGCSTCCPPPIPCSCMPPPVPPVPTACQPSNSYTPIQCGCAARMHDGKTVVAQPLDELELRARVSGIQLDQQPTLDSPIGVPRQLELLERLCEDRHYYENVEDRSGNPPRARSYFASSNVRFSPTNRSSKEPLPVRYVIDESRHTIDKSTTPEPEEEVSLSSVEHVAEEDQDVKCNSQVLKRLMLEKMSDNSALSKRQINIAAENIFGGNIDVICSRGHFSYIYSSSLYCEASKGPTTCIAFRQTK